MYGLSHIFLGEAESDRFGRKIANPNLIISDWDSSIIYISDLL